MQPKTLRNIILLILLVALLAFGGFALWSRIKYPGQPIGTTIKKTFPFGTPTPTQNQGDTTSPDTTTGTGDGTPATTSPETPFAPLSKGERLRQITKVPVSGYGTFEGEVVSSLATIDPKTGVAGFETVSTPIPTVRYAVSKTGYLYDAQIDTATITQKQTTNTQIPSPEEVLFTNDANTALFRFWNSDTDHIDTVSGEVPTADSVVPAYCKVTLTADLIRGKTTAKNKDEVNAVIGFLNNQEGLSLKADGVFGKKTEAAVRDYQKENGLTETGTVNAETRAKIGAVCSEIETKVAEEQNKPRALTVKFLPEDILQVSIAPDTGKIFTLTKLDNGDLGGTLYDKDLSHPTKIFRSPFTEWMPDTPGADTAMITTYASGKVDGYLYQIDPKSEGLIKRYGPTQGLTTKTSPNGKYTLISGSEGKTLLTKMVDIQTGDEKDLGFNTLAEKCVWSGDSKWFICSVPRTISPGTYPDAWYQGQATFADDFWIVHIEPFEIKSLYQSNFTHDYIRPVLDSSGKYLFVTDRNTGNLWVLRIED